ncbi:unnamed protein product [Rotaria magnacalcarata]|uniref:Uncharacterized protein n=1 Tax=Rotaria magnacalcarata TaxID=392030 RepID=A0A819W6L7_9BILA|nr:unnamed protein product [Rotaria magnacalcarata]CAF1300018.1 unnamed protein product [Rotaria magnacalcarata]CAF2017199.1 unnamed protein product [Rotaria magnacalcarata]CAF2058370.1 unnamed protein product [Rotaria magnacalcarata]CAF2144402.1 unnamed protein product [Rotaria magnacalcarata]
MTCLVHNARYRGLFHAVVNELRNENRIPVNVLRIMPHQCCTCANVDNQTLITVILDDTDKLVNLKKLTDQIDRDKNCNPKLIQSLNKFKNLISKNRTSDSNLLLNIELSNDSSSSRNSRTPVERRQSKLKAKPKKIAKTGKFVFLPYKSEDLSQETLPVDDAKRLQRGRFIGRKGYIALLETEHDVCINMITSSTSEQIAKMLQNAKKGVGNVKLHNQKHLSEKENGEWILVRPKNSKGQIKKGIDDLEELLNEITNRWERSMKITKRKREEKYDDDDDDDHGEHLNKRAVS